MPLTLAKIATNTASVTLQVGEDTVTVDYYPGRVTEKSIAQMQSFAAVKAEDTDAVLAGFATFNRELAKLIKSWDIYEDDAQTVMFPIDPARFGELPISFRMEVLNAIVGDIRPETVAPQTTTNQTKSSWN